MPEKPTTASGYPSGYVELVRATCLYIATKLGDLSDEVVVIGGLAPSLIIDQRNIPEGIEPHVGTMDLDVGLTMAVLDEGRYRTLTERLRRAGFSMDVNDQGKPTRQRWKIEGIEKVTVDFLIQPTLPGDRGGKLRHIEPDFAAIIAPGLHLAFQDRRKVELSGKTIVGEEATREVWVCGPGAYVVLKALAFNSRGENKDAYDLFYVIRNFASGPADVAGCLRPMLRDASANEAIDILRRDFTAHDAVGTRRAVEFIAGGPDDDIQASVVAFVRLFLDELHSNTGD